MTDRQVNEGTGRRPGAAVRTARISWLTDPPRGHATVSVGSRALAALPMSFGAPTASPA